MIIFLDLTSWILRKSIISIWMFPKIVGFPPNHPILIGFSMIFTIHFGGNTPIFGNTHLFLLKCYNLSANLKWLTSPKLSQATVVRDSTPHCFGCYLGRTSPWLAATEKTEAFDSWNKPSTDFLGSNWRIVSQHTSEMRCTCEAGQQSTAWTKRHEDSFQ